MASNSSQRSSSWDSDTGTGKRRSSSTGSRSGSASRKRQSDARDGRSTGEGSPARGKSGSGRRAGKGSGGTRRRSPAKRSPSRDSQREADGNRDASKAKRSRDTEGKRDDAEQAPAGEQTVGADSAKDAGGKRARRLKLPGRRRSEKAKETQPDTDAGEKTQKRRKQASDWRKGVVERHEKLFHWLRVGLIIIAATVMGFLVLSHTDLLPITNITVEGNNYLSAEEVIEIAQVPEDTTFFHMNGAKICKKLDESPWIESSRVKHSFFDGMVLCIQERTVHAIVDVPVTASSSVATAWAVDGQGRWLAMIAEDSAAKKTSVTNDDGTTTTTTSNADGSSTVVTTDKDGKVVSSQKVSVSTADDGTRTQTTTDKDGNVVQIVTTVTHEDGSQTVTTTDENGDVTNTEELSAEEAAAAAESSSGDSQAAGDESGSGSGEGQEAAGEPGSEDGSSHDVDAAARERIAQQSGDLPTIINVSTTVVPEPDAVCEDGGINAALTLLDELKGDMAEQVKTVSASDARSLTVALDNGIEIAFGTTSDIDIKQRVAEQLISEHEGSITYINVRVADRPAWRGLG